MGFGLNAYVAVGIKQAKPWAWVVTIDDEIVFWDAASGERFKHVQVDPDLPMSKQTGARPKHTFKTIDCLFNHCEFYGNIQDMVTKYSRWNGSNNASKFSYIFDIYNCIFIVENV